jgi:acyl carrier protein
MALLPAPGLASYVAANAGLDALAQARRAEGLTALSVNWGPWQDIGMADRGPAAQWASQGLQPLAAGEYLARLDALLAGSEVHVAVMKVATEVPGVTLRQPPSAATPTHNVRQAILRLPKRRQRAALADYVAQTVAAVLHLDSADDIERSAGFFALGMDSLTTLDLRNRIQAALRCRLEPTVFFRHSSVHSLTDYLATELVSQPSLEAVR